MSKKTIFITLTIIFTFIIIEFFSFATLKIYKIYNKDNKASFTDENEYFLANDIVEKKNYFAFYGWKGFYSDTNKYKVRETTINKKSNNKNNIFFFGGSTTLGTGVKFDQTISSHFSNLDHKFQPVNFGEHSYVSGQSLNRLIEINNEIKQNDIVIFYEGVNDVIHSCQKNNSFGHSRVAQINELIKNENRVLYNFLKKYLSYFQNLNSFNLINGVSKKLFNYDLKYQYMKDNYFCDDKNNAEIVANNIVRHWKTAEVLSKNRGAKFYAFLQPSPYTADFEVNQAVRATWKKSFDDVYPIIRSKIKNRKNFFDISKILQKDYYLDWCCHLSSEGNKFIAEVIYSNTIN